MRFTNRCRITRRRCNFPWTGKSPIPGLQHPIAPPNSARLEIKTHHLRYFAKKPTDKSIQRGSWGFEVDQPLFMPPGDPHENFRSFQSPELDLSRLHLRVDWQTLRRLPLTGAIIFNFKALFTPISSFRDEPFVPALALKVLNEGKKNIMDYKATWHTEHVAKPALEKWKREHEEKGWVPKGWEPHTLDESPYFPGWEEKWRNDQGF